MTYQVLARRWRPKTFAEVVGQEHITRTIKNALKQGRLAHAFLFTGPRGVGKTSTARILARAVNCTRIDLTGDAEPCNECETCRALFEDRELDVIEMDAASYTGVDDIRRINESCRLAPVAGQKKIYIIDEVHMLSRSAFNAFLKTLEEPPSHVIFILATTDVHKVLPTVLSRVQRLDFRPLQPNDMAPHLAKICDAEGWAYERDALWLIARKAEGSLRDAEGLLDQVVSFAGKSVSLEVVRDVLGVLPAELFAQATQLIAERNASGVPAYLDQLALDGVDYTELLRGLQSYWLDLTFLKQDLPITGRGDEEMTRMKQAGTELTIEDLFRLMRLAEGLEDAIKWSMAPRIRFEVAFLRWVSLDRLVTIQDILKRLDAPAPKPAVGSSATSDHGAASRTNPPSAPPPDVSAGGKTELANLRMRWPEIVSALRKQNRDMAVFVETAWELSALEGNTLAIRCMLGDRFNTDRLKASFPVVADVIHSVCGRKLLLVPAMAVGGRAASVDTGVTSAGPPAAGAQTVFDNFMSRFGGVEIEPPAQGEAK